MRLAVFDLDGTLADTLAVDHRCFIEAFRSAHGIEFVDEDWSTYAETTDSGITPEVLTRAFGRPATAAEVDEHKHRFIELLAAAAADEPESFRQVPGAGRLLEELAERPDWAVVVATGSWHESARLKLRAAGLEGKHLPLASADDARSRERIVAHGCTLVAADGPFDEVVLVGDKPWDLAAARHHGFGFVGVATSGRRKLSEAGAQHLIDHFADTASSLAVLTRASRAVARAARQEVRP